jgi:hypothetical protein
VSRRGALLVGGMALLPTRTLAAAAAPSGAADILRDPKWPESFPFGASELGRYDESSDSAFYAAPRFVTHIDDGAIAALTAHYAKVFPKPGPGVALLGAPLADGGLWLPAERHTAGGPGGFGCWPRRRWQLSASATRWRWLAAAAAGGCGGW